MKYLSLGYFVAVLFLATSCQKDDQISCDKNDHRDQLIGTYVGTLEYQDVVHASETNEETTAADKLVDQTIEISKSLDNENELMINGNPLNVVPQSLGNKNEFSDVFIYTVQDCSGRESYTLEFYPAEKKLVLNYEHRRDCSTGKLVQNSIFEGIKAAF